MRIAEVAPTFLPSKNGIATVAYNNAWSLATLGHDVTVFTPRYAKGPFADEYPFKVERLNPWFKYGNAGVLPQLVWKLRKFDVIHLHYPFFGGSEIIYFLDKFRDLKLVLTYHMDVVGIGLLSKFFRWHTNNVLPRVLDMADKVIVTSWDYAKYSDIGDRLEVEPEKYVEIPCGVNHLLFRPRLTNKTIMEKYELHGKKVILFVGALDKAHYFKGVNVLIQAIDIISDRDDFRVLIVGEGNLKEGYQTLVESMGLGKKIIFTGFVSDDMLPKYYNVADIFVLPSIDKSEAFGIVSLEAMASGLPVIASDLSGVRSVVDKKRTGLLVKPGSAKNLADMIQFLLKNPNIASTYGEAGREKVLSQYTWEKIGYRLDNVMQSVVK